MDFSLLSEEGLIALKPVFPDKWKRFLLRGSQPLSATGDFGSVLIQQYENEHFSIRYFVLDLLQKITLQWREEEKLVIQSALSEDFRYDRDQAQVQLKTRQYNLVWAPGSLATASFPKGKLCRFFHSLYPATLVQKLVPSFFTLPGQQIETKVFYMEPEVSDAVNKILDAHYEPPALNFFFENRMRDIVFTTLQKGGRKFFKGITQNDLAAIYQADELIINNLDKHFTITEIAAKVGLNEFKLKVAFKKIIGMALFERLHKARMGKARTLLLQTDLPMKAIYETIGYDHLTSFITSFRKHFGVTPGEIRRAGS